MTVGDRIKRLRIQKEISQVELASKIQSTKQSLYKYENNIITNIPSDKIEMLADTLEVSPAYLMGWVDEPNGTIPESGDIIFVGGKVIHYDNLSEENQKKLEEYYSFLKAKEEGRI